MKYNLRTFLFFLFLFLFKKSTIGQTEPLDTLYFNNHHFAAVTYRHDYFITGVSNTTAYIIDSCGNWNRLFDGHSCLIDTISCSCNENFHPIHFLRFYYPNTPFGISLTKNIFEVYENNFFQRNINGLDVLLNINKKYYSFSYGINPNDTTITLISICRERGISKKIEKHFVYIPLLKGSNVKSFTSFEIEDNIKFDLAFDNRENYYYYGVWFTDTVGIRNKYDISLNNKLVIDTIRWYKENTPYVEEYIFHPNSLVKAKGQIVFEKDVPRKTGVWIEYDLFGNEISRETW